MRKYSLGLVFVSTLLISQGHSDFQFGGMLGGNFTTFSTSVSRTGTISGSTYSGELGPSGLFGFQVGGVARYDQPDWMLELDTIYTNRSAQWHGQLDQASPGSGTVRNSLELTLTQIEVPFVAYYKIPGEMTDFKFGLGLYLSYGIGKIKVKDSVSSSPGVISTAKYSYTWKEFGFKQVNFGGLIAAGTNFKLGTNKDKVLGVEVRGQGSFSDYRDTLNPNFQLGGQKVGLLSLDLDVSYMF